MDIVDGICSVVDIGVESMLDILDSNKSKEWADYILASFVLGTSFFFIFLGARIIRPVVVLSTSIGIFLGSYTILMQYSQIKCLIRFICSFVLCVGTAILSSCILKIGLFLLGFVSVAGSLHLLFLAAPVLDTLALKIGPRSIAYYVVISIGGLVGGIFLRMNNVPTLEIITSVVGGTGCGYAVHSFVTLSYGNNIPHVVYLCIGVLTTVIGILYQRRSRMKIRTQPCIRP